MSLSTSVLFLLVNIFSSILSNMSKPLFSIRCTRTNKLLLPPFFLLYLDSQACLCVSFFTVPSLSASKASHETYFLPNANLALILPLTHWVLSRHPHFSWRFKHCWFHIGPHFLNITDIIPLYFFTLKSPIILILVMLSSQLLTLSSYIPHSPPSSFLSMYPLT